jgi:chromosome transmission fidelity protein 4
LAFNHIGLIYSIDHDHQNLIHVEFHDRTTYRGHQFDDNFKFTLASLGERGAAYAAPARGEHASVVNYRPYQSWTAGADWQYELPKGESAVALGVGGAPSLDVDDDLLPVLGMGCVVVGTDAGYIRFFGASGLQIHLIDLGEEIVSLAVGREWVMVIHRTTGLTADCEPFECGGARTDLLRQLVKTCGTRSSIPIHSSSSNRARYR